MRSAMLNNRFLLLSEAFASDYMANVEHFNNPANAGKIDDFFKAYYEQKIAASKEIYSFDGQDAHIRIEGPMSPTGPDLYDIFYGYGGVAYADILDGIEQAKADVDPKTGKLYLHGNTPGGTVAMVDDVYQSLATCGLHTVMLNKGLVASGGVWLGAACTEIEATTPVAFTGSIGVVISCYDLSGMLEKMGVKRIVITNHEASEKIPDISTPEGQRVIQQELQAIYTIFKQRVMTGRRGKMSEAAIDALKGSVKVASEALSIGLIDRISDKASTSGHTNRQPRAQATAEPASKGVEAMNLQQLKADHPDLVAAITAEAREGMISADQHQTSVAAARTEGATAEVTRINTVRAQAIPGHEKLIENMAFDGKSTAADAALAIINAEQTQRAAAGKQTDSDANPVVDPVVDGGGSVKTMKRANFNALGQDARRAFISGGGKVVE